MQWWWWGV